MDKEFERMIFEAGLPLGNIKPPGTEERLAAFRRKRRRMLTLRYSAAAAVATVLILIPFALRNPADKEMYVPAVGPVYVVDNNGHTMNVNDLDDAVGFATRTGENSLRYDPARSDIVPDSPITHTLIVPKGVQFALTLSDGTLVRVNSGTSVTYPAHFSPRDERRITLNYGEIFLEVTHDGSSPFIVSTTTSETKVLGTRFNVYAYSEDICDVTLLEGSVAVRLPHQLWDDSRTIKPGENASVTRDEVRVSTVDTKKYAAWINGYYYYDKQTVGKILEDICVRYDYVLEGTLTETDLIRFWFDNDEDMSEVIARLAKVANMVISIEANVIKLN